MILKFSPTTGQAVGNVHVRHMGASADGDLVLQYVALMDDVA